MLVRTRLGLGVAGTLLLTSAAAADTRVQFRGMSLEQAIAELEGRGLNIVYSSALVKPWMGIRAEPTAVEPADVLEEILEPFGLRIRPAPNAVLAIVRGVPPAETPRTVDRAAVVVVAGPPSPPVNQALEQIVVAASRYELTRNLVASLSSISSTDIESLPDVSEDTLRAVAWLPGAASNGISARTNMRGGAADENLLRFDGLRLYQPFHLKDFQSLFSAIDPRIVSSVDVYTGGFGARFGDRMSSVVDITSLTPPAPRYHEIGVSFFNTSLLGAGHFANGRGEWLASGRRGNLDVWYHALSNQPGTPRYADAFAKVSYRLSDRLRVTGSALYFGDEVSLSAEDGEERANAAYSDRYMWMRFDQKVNDFLTGSTLLAHTHLRSERTGTTEREGVATGALADHREFDIESLQTDWSWRVMDHSVLQFGGEVRFARGVYEYSDDAAFELLFDTPGAPEEPSRSRSIRVEPKKTQYALYATARYGITPRLTTDMGLRWESDKASPRIGMRYELGPRTAVRASWARMVQSQSIDELPVSDGLTIYFPPQRADHTSLAIEHRLTSGVELRAELYDKRQKHLQPRFENLLNPITLVPELNPDRIRIAPDRGSARGVELSLLKPRGDSPLSWWVSFSRSLAQDREGGIDVYRGWDQRNALSAGFDWSTERWNLSLGLIQRSGWPTTAVQLEESEPLPLVVTGVRNGDRSVPFRSLNARIARNYALDHSALSVFFEVTNALGRDNPCCSAFEFDQETGGLEIERQYAVPRLPSLGFLWQF